MTPRRSKRPSSGSFSRTPTELTAYAMLGRAVYRAEPPRRCTEAVRGRRRQAAQGPRRRDDDRHDLRDAGPEERGAAPVREGRAAGCHRRRRVEQSGVDVRGRWRQPGSRAAARAERQEPHAESSGSQRHAWVGLLQEGSGDPRRCPRSARPSTRIRQNPTYQYHLGLAYAKTGDRQKAKEALQRALAIKADFSGAEEAKKVLETL